MIVAYFGGGDISRRSTNMFIEASSSRVSLSLSLPYSGLILLPPFILIGSCSTTSLGTRFFTPTLPA